jgi:hypothetical protein
MGPIEDKYALYLQFVYAAKKRSSLFPFILNHKTCPNWQSKYENVDLREVLRKISYFFSLF